MNGTAATDFNGFRGAARRLDDIDLPRIGSRIGVGEDEIHALMEVEAGGAGFDSQGRPKMLFEPHVFWRNLPKVMRAEAQRQGLAYPKWRPGAYPKDSYPRLIQAVQIDETAALKAASWGRSQILGENHKAAGYDTVQEMVLAFMDDEETHIDAMVSFLDANFLDDDLRAHRWAAVARGYNGAGYAANKYDEKLAAAYAKWKRIKDTVYDAARNTEMRERTQEEPLAAFEIEAIQKRLRDLGYYHVGKVDGIWGSSTTGALSAFQHDNGLSVNGMYDAVTRQALATAKPKPVAPERAQTTAKDLAAQGSTTIQKSFSINLAAIVAAIPAVLSFISYVAQNWQGTELPFPFNLALSFVPPWATPLILIAFCAFSYAQAQGIINARVKAERVGLHNGEPDPAPSPPLKHASDTPHR